MKIEIPYGDGKVPIEIKGKNPIQLIYPNEVEDVDGEKALLKGLENPIDSKSFDNFLNGAKNILFIVNDATRPTPTAKILNILYNRIKNKNIKFIVATGVHRIPTEKEYKFIFGDYYADLKDKIFVHESKKKENMVYMGKTSKGTEVYLNKIILEADKIVTIGSVEPHYFAGYTGGRKSFLPGIASFDTIEQNHKYALDAKAKSLALKGNPVHEDMVDALSAVEEKEIFSIQTVLNKKHKIYSVSAGDIHASFEAAVPKANDVFTVKIREKADIVVSIVCPPMDIDLYQSQKGIENAKLALKKGGILILVSQCKMGIGDRTFFELLSGEDTPLKVIEKVKRGYKLGYHKSAKIAQLCLEAEIWAVTDIGNRDIESIFIKPFSHIQEAINKAIEKKGEKANIIFFFDGSLSVPQLS